MVIGEALPAEEIHVDTFIAVCRTPVMEHLNPMPQPCDWKSDPLSSETQADHALADHFADVHPAMPIENCLGNVVAASTE